MTPTYIQRYASTETSVHQLERVVASGTFIYAGAVECELRIVLSPTRHGSGDSEDDPEFANDAPVETYYVQYGSTTQRGVFNACGGAHPSLAGAVAAAEAAPGIGPTVRWHSVAT